MYYSCHILFPVMDLKKTTKDITKFVPHSCRYVQKSITTLVTFSDIFKSTSLSFNYMSIPDLIWGNKSNNKTVPLFTTVYLPLSLPTPQTRIVWMGWVLRTVRFSGSISFSAPSSKSMNNSLPWRNSTKKKVENL